MDTMKASLEQIVLALVLTSGVHGHELLRGDKITELGKGSNNVTAGDGFFPMAVEKPYADSDSFAPQPPMVKAPLRDNLLSHVHASVATTPNRAPNTLTDQIICGYQGWFSYPGDGSPINGWKHWFSSSADAGAVGLEDLTVDLYPTVDEYDDEDLIETGILMNDGSHAKFYSAVKPGVVLKHFEWMSSYGITGVFHMRFMTELDQEATREWRTMVLRNVKDAAETTGRSFAVSYNIAGNNVKNGILEDLKADWMRLVDEENITRSDRYIQQGGLPVLRIYGIGFKRVKVTDTTKMAELIDWFQNGAEPKYRVFLVGGVPGRWREGNGDSRAGPAWKNIYDSLDGIHPWHVGRWHTPADFDKYYSETISIDAKHCNDKGILYMPTMWPGFSWYNLMKTREPKVVKYLNSIRWFGASSWYQAARRAADASINYIRKPHFDGKSVNSVPRLGGKFMWQQAFRYAADSNIHAVWMAQFDEVDEGTAIYKVAATRRDLTVKGTWLALDDDGEYVPSDWYLRLCGEAQKMLAGEISLSPQIPIQPFPVAEYSRQTEH